MSNYNPTAIAAADMILPDLCHTVDELAVMDAVVRQDSVTCPLGLSARQCVLRIVQLSRDTGCSVTTRQVGNYLVALYGWSISDAALAGYVAWSVEACI